MAAYPTAKSARIPPRIKNESGTPVTPVTAKVVVTPPARTVSGAEAAIIIKVTAGTPRRLLVSAGPAILPLTGLSTLIVCSCLGAGRRLRGTVSVIPQSSSDKAARDLSHTARCLSVHASTARVKSPGVESWASSRPRWWHSVPAPSGTAGIERGFNDRRRCYPPPHRSPSGGGFLPGMEPGHLSILRAVAGQSP